MLLSFSREYALSLAGSHSTMLSFLFDYDLLILAGSHLAMLSQYKYKQGVIRLALSSAGIHLAVLICVYSSKSIAFASHFELSSVTQT